MKVKGNVDLKKHPNHYILTFICKIKISVFSARSVTKYNWSKNPGDLFHICHLIPFFSS